VKRANATGETPDASALITSEEDDEDTKFAGVASQALNTFTASARAEIAHQRLDS
jgi:hypothetical protein